MIEKKIRQERVIAERAKIDSPQFRIDSRRLAERLITVLGQGFFYEPDFRITIADADSARPVSPPDAESRWLVNGAGKRELH